MKKCVKGSVVHWVQLVIFSTHNEYDAKKKRLEIGSGRVGEKSILKSNG